jgi:putative ABC transport system permease protein
MGWFASLFRKRRVEKQLDAELRFHLDEQTRDYIAAGMGPAEARRRVALEFGGIEQIKEDCREVRSGRLFEDLLQDLGYALRSLRKSPAFAATAILTLALGIALNVAVFGVMHAVLLRPLGLPEEDRLVVLRQSNLQNGIAEERVSPANFVDWEAQARVFEEVGFRAAWGGSGTFHLVWPDRVERIQGAYASSGFFRALGMPALLGRTFTPAEDSSKQQASVILSAGFWKERFGSDPAVLGQTIEVDSFQGGRYTIVGVMPEGFDYPRGAQVWLPAGFMGVELPPLNAADRCCPWLEVIGRLHQGITLEQARVELSTIARGISQHHPEASRVSEVTVTPLREELVGDQRLALAVLFGAVGCVLLIACVNVANLLLSRGVNRRAELALRMALGASRGRIVRQLCAESLVLAAAGTALGVVGAVWTRRLLLATLDGRIPLAESARLDVPALLFVSLLMLACAAVFGLAPAAQVKLANWLARESAQSLESQRLRSILVTAEMALAVLLLAGAGLFLRTWMALQEVDPGFRPAQVLVVSFDLTTRAFRGPGNQQPYFFDLMERVSGLPGVEAVAGASRVPLQEPAIAGQPITLEGEPARTASESPRVAVTAVTPAYFSALGIPLRSGRPFRESDSGDGALVAVLSETAARRYWPGQDPVGKRFYLGSLERMGFFRRPPREGEPEWREIVAVVADVKNAGLDAPPEPEIFFNYRQYPWYSAALVARARGDAADLAAAVRKQARIANPSAVISNVVTLNQIVADSIAEPSYRFRLIAAFSALSLLLAALGIYGVFSYTVAQRTREIGIRVALGAQPADVTRLILGRVLRLSLAGVALGLLGTVLLARWISSLLFGVSAIDPLTLAGSCLLLAAASLAAGYLPARRASRVDPLVALREQ